jgi:flagellar hook-associated protein 3 FlgL
MTMRITQGMGLTGLLGDLNRLQESLGRTQRSLSSGRSLEHLADDPLLATRAVRLSSEQSALEQYERNISQATNWLNTSDTALGEMTDFVHRARELTLQGASDSTGAEARASIAMEIDQLIDGVKLSANASTGGVYVFAGTSTTTPPYSTADDVYHGDSGAVIRDIGPQLTAQINTPLNASPSPVVGGSAPPDTGLISTLRTIAANLRANNGTALRTTDLQALDANLTSLTEARATLGATQNRLDAAASRLGDAKQATITMLSDTVDTDPAKALLDLSNQQTAYQAALRSGASIIQPSLLDFLR